ncbi:hypothetical protein CL684_02675 [Candidatus Campbellbacteria bacterium]|nr:hypothetical protein [Candidatus Campbellbacteria bacterium]|tara:strand:- start:62 stop:352 length:291 start_codon:yes stop_codon:yes gene_type:complete
METTYLQKEKGSIKWIILIVIAVIIASYFFDFDVQEAVEDEQTQSNFAYIKESLINFYNEHLAQIVEPIWDFFKRQVEHFTSDPEGYFDEVSESYE